MEKSESNAGIVGAALGASPGLIIGFVMTIMASGSGESGLAAMGFSCFLSIVVTIIGAIIGLVAGYAVDRSRKYYDDEKHDIDDILPPDMR